MKDYDKNKESSHLKYWEVNNLYEWAVSQKFPVNGFKWVENTSQFDEDIGKSFNEESDERYSFEVDIEYSEELHEVNNDLPFLLERMEIDKVEKRACNLHDKKRICSSHKKFKKRIKSWISFRKSS